MFTSIERNIFHLETLIKKPYVQDMHTREVNLKVKTEHSNATLSHLRLVKALVHLVRSGCYMYCHM
jgi:hypothetical protein